jgi:hypothetical protein
LKIPDELFLQIFIELTIRFSFLVDNLKTDTYQWINS